MHDKLKPLDYHAPEPRPTWADRFARVSGNRWTVVITLALLTVQSIVIPNEVFRGRNVWVLSTDFSLVFATFETDLLVGRMWIPYPLLAVFVLWRPLRGR